MMIFVSIIIICFTVLMCETMYFNHKEKMAKLNAENRLLNKLFSGNKNNEEN